MDIRAIIKCRSELEEGRADNSADKSQPLVLTYNEAVHIEEFAATRIDLTGRTLDIWAERDGLRIKSRDTLEIR